MQKACSARAHSRSELPTIARPTRPQTTPDTAVRPAPTAATTGPHLIPEALLALQRCAGNAAVACAVQRAEPAPADDHAPQVDPLEDEETMRKVAVEGARQLDAILSTYTLGCRYAKSAITLSEALAAHREPDFSDEYEAMIATIRTQALDALRQAKANLENLDPRFPNTFGGAALEGVNVAISAIEDGNDIVFIVDSRSVEGQTVLAGIDHFAEQLAIRNRGFQDESGESKRLSAGLSVHEGQIDPDKSDGSPRVAHRSISIVDIGALYDNRVFANFVGPVLDPPGRIVIENAAAVDARAIFIHEVGGHALDIETPAERERRKKGQSLHEGMNASHKLRMEDLVDNMVNAVTLLSFIGDDMPRELIWRTTQ